MKTFDAGGISIGQDAAPFIIAEMSGNHGGSLEQALKIVDAAKASGADAIKLQTYTADTMTLNCDRPEFFINNPNSLWHGQKLYELYQKAHTPWEWHKPIMERAKQQGLLCFSTPFDETAVDFLEHCDVPLYKIASFENTDTHLLARVAKTKKPVIVSTGMASLSDLELMVNTLRQHGCHHFVLLKCTSAYPAPPSEANLMTLPHLSRMFNCQVGLSDHTLGIGVAIASVALGASVIEKHFCLSRQESTVDSAFSLEPHEFRELATEARRAKCALGNVHYGACLKESESLQFKRSIYFSENMLAGDIITEKHIRCIRPGFGLSPHYFNTLIGKRLKTNVVRGEPVSFSCID